MSEYIPTEARICIDFCNAATKRAQADGSFMSMEEADAAFSRWLAAHDAEVRAGVVAEEPEWEYRSHVVNDLKRHVLSDWTDEETALAIIGWESGRPREAAWIERRRPAGEPERVPVKQEGTER